jgi:Tfp pilus assembly protein PilF
MILNFIYHEKMHLIKSLPLWVSNFFFYFLIIAFPFFILPISRDFIVYGKIQLIAFVIGVTFLSTFASFIFSKKIIWTHNPATQSMVLIVLSVILSILLISPNKVQAIYNPIFGLTTILLLILMYYGLTAFFARIKTPPVVLLSISAGITALLTLVVMVDPFKNVTLPNDFIFLSNKLFNPIGSSYHFIAFLVAVLLMIAMYVWRTFKVRHSNKEQYKVTIISLGVISAFILLSSVFHIFLVFQQISKNEAQLLLPPLDISWFAAVEILKNPLSALFGVGVDNFSSVFPQVRTIEYNQTPLWEINSFITSGSAFTHVITELGLLGGFAFGLLILTFVKKLKEVKLESATFFVATIVTLLILPPSIISLFMFFVSLAVISSDLNRNKHFDSYSINLAGLMPIYVSAAVLGVVLFGGFYYLIFKNSLSEYYFKQSLNGISENNLEKLYTFQLRAVQEAGYNEEFRRQLAGTNILIANNIASKGQDKLTENDKQYITQAIQAAIAEAKASVSLNPSRVVNWQVLADTYRQIINVVEDAPVWTVSAYQQAIVLDPRNPALRLDLGGVFYLFKNYDDAQKMFEQAVSLKQDWANARYNLGWTLYQKEQYGPAVEQMQLVVGLIDPSKQSEDYTAAQKVLDDFKKKNDEQIKKNESSSSDKKSTSQNAVQPPRQLNLPQQPETQLEEKLNLPDSASPSTGESPAAVPETRPDTVTPTQQAPQSQP